MASLIHWAVAVRDAGESDRTPGPGSLLRHAGDVAGTAEGAQSSAEGAVTKSSLICPETHVHFALSLHALFTPTHARVHAHTEPHMCTSPGSHALTHTRRHTCASTRARINAHVCTHTHVRTCTCMLSRNAHTPAHAPGATPQQQASTRTRRRGRSAPPTKPARRAVRTGLTSVCSIAGNVLMRDCRRWSWRVMACTLKADQKEKKRFF